MGSKKKCRRPKVRNIGCPISRAFLAREVGFSKERSGSQRHMRARQVNTAANRESYRVPAGTAQLLGCGQVSFLQAKEFR